MLSFKKQRRWWLTWKAPAAVLVALLLVATGYSTYLYIEVTQRFDSRRWSIPSRIFSATVPLYPGQQLGLSHVKQLLEERGYQEAIKEPLQAGEYKIGRDTVTAYLREFQFPGRALASQRVDFTFQQSTLVSVKSGRTEIAFLELEPLEVARLFGPDRESRLLVNITQVPTYLVDGVLAIEDHRFYEHRGVDWRAMLRALYTDITAGRVVEGGSTITQQLVKNYFLEPARTFRRKFQEATMAVILEAIYEKQAILEMYLNEIYMGQRGSAAIHGMGEAARYYFGRNVDDLTLSECATLAGMIRAPSIYSPVRNPQAVLDRRNLVLKRMLNLGMIPDLEYEKARGQPLRTATPLLPRNFAPHFVDHVQQQLRELYEEKILASEGLTIYTALHPEMALLADRVLKEELAWLEKDISDHNATLQPSTLQAAILAVQPKTGSILALVGGRNYGPDILDRTQLSRPAGSVIMPLIYLSALDQMTPASWLVDEPRTCEDREADLIPADHDNRYLRRILFRDALEQSSEAATADLAVRVGAERISTTLRSFGLTPPVTAVLPLALGEFPITAMQLARAFCGLDNDGQKPYLLGVKEVVAESGEVQQRRHVEFVAATSAARACLITSILQGAVRRGAPGEVSSAGLEFPLAAQSGFSPEMRDGWYVGYTTDLQIVVWLGYDDHRPLPPAARPAAARLGLRFIHQVRPWIYPQEFPIPPGIAQRLICLQSGQLTTPRCREKRLEVFLEENVPNEYCVLHR